MTRFGTGDFHKYLKIIDKIIVFCHMSVTEGQSFSTLAMKGKLSLLLKTLGLCGILLRNLELCWCLLNIGIMERAYPLVKTAR